jgi:hypothetical protein
MCVVRKRRQINSFGALMEIAQAQQGCFHHEAGHCRQLDFKSEASLMLPF